MSYDLGVFYTTKPHSDDDAGERYAAFCDEPDLPSLIEPSPRVAAFLKELTDRYPQIDDAAEEDFKDCPWSIAFDVSEGHVLMPMTFPKAGAMIEVIAGLAEKHGLVCFDPQEGKILTAPPGIHVAETVPTEEELERDRKKRDVPFVELLDGLLNPHGFERRRRLWRKNGEKAVITLSGWDDDGIYEIWLYAWFKALGEVDPGKVKSGGKFHICEELVSDFIPERLQFSLLRAFHFDGDYADSIQRLYGTDQTAQEIESYFEPREPLTTEWRVATLREAIEKYVLPWFARIEAGDQKVISERKQRRETISQEAIDQDWQELKAAIAQCRQRRQDGADDEALIAGLKSELMFISSVVVALSAALGWTIDEAKAKAEASGRWQRGWDTTQQGLFDEMFEWHPNLVRYPDGKLEIR